tara:strand:+ start:540 stop:1115 length:576 start_codon:yes stop_codon:yes gene_type:complete
MSLKKLIFTPPYWTHSNIKFSDEEIEFVLSEYKSKVPFENDNYTSFPPHHPKPELIWKEKYHKIISDIMSNLGLQTTTKYNYHLWGQLYLNGNSHFAHHHFHPIPNSCHNAAISFVHFIKPADETLFRFVNLKGDEIIPKEQKEGDLILFPSWLWHAAFPNKSNKQRFIVAGNINITYTEDTCPEYFSNIK